MYPCTCRPPRAPRQPPAAPCPPRPPSRCSPLSCPVPRRGPWAWQLPRPGHGDCLEGEWDCSWGAIMTSLGSHGSIVSSPETSGDCAHISCSGRSLLNWHGDRVLHVARLVDVETWRWWSEGKLNVCEQYPQYPQYPAVAVYWSHRSESAPDEWSLVTQTHLFKCLMSTLWGSC